MPVKDKIRVEAARLGMWNSLHKAFALNANQNEFGQSGEVDRRQRAKYHPSRIRLSTAINFAQTFFWFGLRRIAHASC
jgi:hypothetical protein